MRKKRSTKIVCTWSLCQGIRCKRWVNIHVSMQRIFLKLNIRKWSFLLLQQGGYNELMAMMSTKRSAKMLKSMAPWVRNSGLWVGTIWLQYNIAYKFRIFTVNGNYLFLLRIIFFYLIGKSNAQSVDLDILGVGEQIRPYSWWSNIFKFELLW